MCIPMYTWYVDLFGKGFNNHKVIEASTKKKQTEVAIGSIVSRFSTFFKTGTISVNLSASGKGSLN